jgi:hypothetical protein
VWAWSSSIPAVVFDFGHGTFAKPHTAFFGDDWCIDSSNPLFTDSSEQALEQGYPQWSSIGVGEFAGIDEFIALDRFIGLCRQA